MSQYHINPVTGSVGKCAAVKAGCPFGGANEHYESPEEARASFEEYMIGHTLPEKTSQELRHDFMVAEAEREVLRGGKVEEPAVAAARLLANESLIVATEESPLTLAWSPPPSETFSNDDDRFRLGKRNVDRLVKRLTVSNDAYTKSASESLTGRPTPEIEQQYNDDEDALAEARKTWQLLEQELQALRGAKKAAVENHSKFLRKKDNWTHYDISQRQVFHTTGQALKEIADATDWDDGASVNNAAFMLSELNDRLNEQGYDAIAADEDPSPYWSAAGGVEMLLEGFGELGE